MLLVGIQEWILEVVVLDEGKDRMTPQIPTATILRITRKLLIMQKMIVLERYLDIWKGMGNFKEKG